MARKPQNETTGHLCQVLIEEAVWQKIRWLAKRRRRTFSFLIRDWIETGLEKAYKPREPKRLLEPEEDDYDL